MAVSILCTWLSNIVQVMDSVVRLVKTYIQLCQGGCLLFLNWAVKFFFDVRGVCCIVEFFQGEDTVKQLKGRRDTHTLEDYMAEVGQRKNSLSLRLSLPLSVSFPLSLSLSLTLSLYLSLCVCAFFFFASNSGVFFILFSAAEMLDRKRFADFML